MISKVARALRTRGRSKITAAMLWRERSTDCFGRKQRVCISQVKRGLWTIMDHKTLSFTMAKSRAAAVRKARAMLRGRR